MRSRSVIVVGALAARLLPRKSKQTIQPSHFITFPSQRKSSSPSLLNHTVSNMAMMYESSLSTSVMRAPMSSADAPSMADSLPPINFGFDELRERMARFTDKFDTFIAQGRKRVLEERNQFRINMAEIQGACIFAGWSLSGTDMQARNASAEQC